VHRIVLREGLTPTLIGLVVGAAATMALGRVFSSLLFEVRPTDPVTLLAVSALLGMVAVLACVIPAQRVTRTRLANLLRME
jgi:putative ABC transport system permease protein